MMSATRRGTVSGMWWAEADVEALRDLVRPVRPTVSMYLEGRRFGVDSAEDLDLRIRSLLGALRATGADSATLEAIRSYSTRLAPAHAQYAVFARDGSIVYQRAMAGPVAFDLARFAAPPVVAPVLRWLFTRPPHVVVVVDRAGAEITSVAGAGGRVVTTTVVGPDDLITAISPRGWSQPRFQRRVEDSWRHNATAVLDAAVQALRHVHARLMFIAGDTRAVHLVRDGLDRARIDVSVREIPGGRTVDGGVLTAAAAGVAEDADARVCEVLTRLREAGGPVGMATEGASETLAALAAGRAEVLLVVDEPADGRLAYFGDELLCSPVRVEPASDVVHGRLVDVAVRAALLRDAHVCVVPAGHPLAPAEGIGAICRYPARSD
jgi:release factor family 2